MSEPIDRYELYRVCMDMEALHEGFRDRIEDLDVSRITINEIGGFTTGYSEKLLCNPPMKWFGRESLPKMLKATGMALVLVVDDERFAEIKGQLAKRKKRVRAVARIKRVKGFFNKKNAREMGAKRWQDVSKKDRSRIARRAIRARWRRIREAAIVSSLLPDATALPEPHFAACQPECLATNGA